ncbi:glycoside hydrolase [Dacryopinax primogenitus]|uniref:Glycoside hydrolase n=1 Tax=Dacryopinax primogenitus (strain DJM 731) TaxID=1858805 RepID=M5FPU3_DACPD|nr:glycoside hydrolase [Dacryopinax primogenitus]EJT96594.1 glycoside hydrolase [Dacryopinax primogenitus]
MVDLTEEIKREIGQHFVIGFHGYSASEDIKTLIKDYHLGNVILMKRNVRDVQQVCALVRELQTCAKESGQERPLMIGIDQENGLVSAFSSPKAGTQFPGAMAIAATDSPALAEEVAYATGRELAYAGINWAYSPIADINSDPRNPVIGVRSFSDDPATVSAFARAVASGLTRAGIAPSPKHFAGHGDTHVDSHLALPVIEKDMKALDQVELMPFKDLIKDSVATIMTGHMALPKVTGDDTPCSLSRRLTKGLLRDELGYEGIIVTDCLEMEAVADKYGSEDGAVRSLEAGADIAMICHRFARHKGAIEATYEAVRTGRLSLDDIRQSGKRIQALKDRFSNSWDSVLGIPPEATWIEMKRAHAALSDKAYAASAALIRDAGGLIPLDPKAPLVLFTPEVQKINLAVDDSGPLPEGALLDKNGKLRNTASPSYLSFAGYLEGKTHTQHMVYGPDQPIDSQLDTILPLAAGTSVIFCTRNADRATWQIDQLRALFAALGTASPRIVVLATCAPYDLLEVSGMKDLSYMATFEFTVPALKTAVKVLFGELKAVGKVPVIGGKA